MSTGAVLSLLLAWMVAVMSPGPDLLMILQQTAPRPGREDAGIGPRARGMATALGIMTGNLLWMVVAAVGLGALVAVAPGILPALKVAGGLFLAWMGFSGLRAVRRARGGHGPAVETRTSTPARSWLRGVAVNLSNPKAIIFFTALFAPFFSHHNPVWQTVLLLALIWTLGMAWFCAFAWITSSAAVIRWVQKYWVTVETVTSVLFLVIGLGFVLDGLLGF